MLYENKVARIIICIVIDIFISSKMCDDSSLKKLFSCFPRNDRGENYAELRKQAIQESKYLGGDMEHTHLVKGLDYALLEKVCPSCRAFIFTC